MLDFIAIDFETANAFRGSPCSVGLVRVRDGQVVDCQHWLIRPPEGADHFDPWNISIHGITQEMVERAPRWKDILPAIVDFIGNDVVVAHNAGFDLSVIRHACALDNIEWPQLRFLCTLVMARRALALPSYRLPFLADSLGIAFNDHHDALADATATAHVACRLAEDHQATDLLDLAASLGVRIGQLNADSYQGSVTTRPGRRSAGATTSIEVNADADPDGYLYGRVVVFTGTLMSMTRDAAREACAKIGAIPADSTTRKTNVLVIGNINPAVLRPGTHLTGKARKAFELQDKGQDIEVMTEDDFLRCLDGNVLPGGEVLLNDETAKVRPDSPGSGVLPALGTNTKRPASQSPAPGSAAS